MTVRHQLRPLSTALCALVALAVALVPMPVCADGPDCSMSAGAVVSSSSTGEAAAPATPGCGGGACPLALAARSSESADRPGERVTTLSCCAGGTLSEILPATLSERQGLDGSRGAALGALGALGAMAGADGLAVPSTHPVDLEARRAGVGPPALGPATLPRTGAARLAADGHPAGGSTGLSGHLRLGAVPLYTLLASLLS